jgi:hypothetical protein
LHSAFERYGCVVYLGGREGAFIVIDATEKRRLDFVGTITGSESMIRSYPVAGEQSNLLEYAARLVY